MATTPKNSELQAAKKDKLKSDVMSYNTTTIPVREKVTTSCLICKTTAEQLGASLC